MHILGIVGGIASGKSTVTAALGDLGATVLDADRAAHEVLQQDEVKHALVARWGNKILDASGQVDRAAIANYVFAKSMEAEPKASDADRQFLEQIIHPRVGEQFQQRMVELVQQGVPVVVIDAPLLLEAGWQSRCSDVVYVDCPENIRLQRAIERGWTKAEFQQREAAQMPIEEKKRHSTVQIKNGDSPDALLAKVHTLWNTRWGGGGPKTQLPKNE